MASSATALLKGEILRFPVSISTCKQPAVAQKCHLWASAANICLSPSLGRHLLPAGETCIQSGQHSASAISANAFPETRFSRCQRTSPRVSEGKRRLAIRASRTEEVQEASTVPDALATQTGAIPNGLVGEDAAVFDVTAQKTSSWVNFTVVLAVVLAILYYVWLDPNTGFGGKFIDVLEGAVGGSHEATIIALLSIFALVHSGGAALRAKAEEVIGPRAYRVLFAGLSLPLAVSSVVYFINHRYDGTQLWQLRTVPGAHELVWVVSFISFFFLYPSTFNLLEVAAVDKPKLHMWETGILRITRHPQMTGQLLWCLAHTLWIGNSFTLVTSLGLCAHHLFGVWHGDRRLEAKYGDAFRTVKARTSVVPFQAIIEGRQKLPQDWYKEYLRVPYFAIVGFTLGAYFSHPLMQQGSFWLHW